MASPVGFGSVGEWVGPAVCVRMYPKDVVMHKYRSHCHGNWCLLDFFKSQRFPVCVWIHLCINYRVQITCSSPHPCSPLSLVLPVPGCPLLAPHFSPRRRRRLMLVKRL